MPFWAMKSTGPSPVTTLFDVTTTNSVVTGLGPVDFIAQNGIEYARDAVGTIRGNTVSGNFYTGKTGVLADGSPCGGTNPACPPGRQYVSVGILLVLIDPSNIQRDRTMPRTTSAPSL